MIYRIRHNKRKRGKRRLQLVLPKGYREEIMEAYHDYPQAGHVDEFKTTENIAQKYWWPNMAKEISEWVKSCLVYQQF